MAPGTGDTNVPVGQLVPVEAAYPTVELVPLAQPVGPRLAQPVYQFVPYAPRLVVGSASSPGTVRARNEDRFQTLQWSWNDSDSSHDVALLVVADGMGGNQAGDEASALTVRTVVNRISALVEAAIGGRTTDGAAVASALNGAIRDANRAVHQQAQTHERCKGMGATAVVMIAWDGHAYFGHVGDCRVYLHHDGELKQLTEDQTLVARMVALGKLTLEEAANHGARNEVLQAVGKRQTVEPSKGEQALARGDYLLLACDGLAAHVETPTLQELLDRPGVPPQHLASQLVALADQRGGSDNCTVIVALFA